MAEISGMWIREPDETPPDVVAKGAWRCETCGIAWSGVASTWPMAALRTTCCGVSVEILPITPPPALNDGPAAGGSMDE